jgi:hypothetical protein
MSDHKCDYCDDGECCTQCSHEVTILKHPWNEGELKGSLDEVLFTGCSVRGKGRIIAFSDNRRHGSCEMFSKRGTNELQSQKSN